MSAAPEILRQIEEIGATIARRGNRLVITAGSVAVPGAIIAALTESKPEIVDLLLRRAAAAGPTSEHKTRTAALEERTAIVWEGAGVPEDWAEAFARLDEATLRDRDPDSRAAQIMDDAGHFLDRWTQTAAALGWSAIDIFGVGPDPSAAHAGHGGLVLLINGGAVEALSVEHASIRLPDGCRVVYLRRPRRSDWERVG